jgi:hypothetical protein
MIGPGNTDPQIRVLAIQNVPQQERTMLSSRSVPLVISVSALLLSLQTTAAQDKSQSNQNELKELPPLIVNAQFSSSPDANCASGNTILVQFHYAGTLPLRGYLVRLTTFNSATGKFAPQETVHEVRTASDPILPNSADWSRTVCTAPTKASSADTLTVTPTIDFLKFDNGSSWGPMHLPESHELIGTIDGMDFSVKSTDLKHYVSPIDPREGPLPQEQIQFQTLGPLRFESGVWHAPKGEEDLAIKATNTGDAPIRGYVFTESFFDAATGARLRRVTTKQLETAGNPAHFLLPGATWVSGLRKFSYSSDGTLAKYTITLDFVVFADGSTYGPKESRESDEVLGMFRGIDETNAAARGISAAANQKQ